MSIEIRPARPAVRVEHERVCARCGHGESLHPMRELACFACDQRISAGLRSAFCVGFLETARTAVGGRA